MKIILLTLAIASITISANAQNKIDWDSTYKIQLSDFQSRGTQIGDVRSLSISTGIQFSFQYAMSNYEFMFTKNFNDKVSNVFTPSMASLIAQDTTQALQFVAFAQYEFDLSELYARKIRQQLFTNKNAFSSFDFFQSFFNNTQQEYGERRNEAANKTNLGQDGFKLHGLHQEVLKEMNELSDFCKECKPKKKKK